MLGYLLFGGGMFMMCMGIIWLLHPEHTSFNYYFAVMYGATGLIVLYAWAEYTGLIFKVFPLYNMQIPLCYLFAPLLYHGFSQITNLRKQPVLRWPLFLPAVLTLPIILLVNLLNAAALKTLQTGVDPASLRVHPSFLAVHGLGLGSNLYILFFLGFILVKGISLLTQDQYKDIKRELFLMILFVGWFFADVVLMSVAHLLKLRELLFIGKFLSSATFVFYAFYCFRYPEFAQQVIRKSKALRYKYSQLRGLNTEAVIERLKYLMESEKVFREQELSLQGLSDRLAVSPHQLSEILNESLGQGFAAYLSGFRIRDARRLLLKRPDMTILDVAFEVGFNSKASFNAHFLEKTGRTPSQYRKENGGKESPSGRSP